MYNYEKVKDGIFSDEGQRNFLKIRDKVYYLLDDAGAFMMENLLNNSSGDTWEQMACVDRLVELGEIFELTGVGVMGQHRVFVKC